MDEENAKKKKKKSLLIFIFLQYVGSNTKVKTYINIHTHTEYARKEN